MDLKFAPYAHVDMCVTLMNVAKHVRFSTFFKWGIE
jgi:hypothetical protein